jgi:hypothetical protein
VFCACGSGEKTDHSESKTIADTTSSVDLEDNKELPKSFNIYSATDKSIDEGNYIEEYQVTDDNKLYLKGQIIVSDSMDSYTYETDEIQIGIAEECTFNDMRYENENIDISDLNKFKKYIEDKDFEKPKYISVIVDNSQVYDISFYN